MEFTASRKHDAFKTSQLSGPRELRQASMSFNRERCTSEAYLYAGSVSLEGVDDGHLCLEKRCAKEIRRSVGRRRELVERCDGVELGINPSSLYR